MPSGSYRQANVKCPYYKFDDGKSRIICEGIVDGSTNTITFKRRNDYDTQIDVFCSGCYQNCEICRMLSEKYEE